MSESNNLYRRSNRSNRSDQSNRIDVPTLKQNLADLNDVAEKFNSILKSKNDVLVAGLADCAACQGVLGRNK